jgi:hypothetical protein
MSAALAPEGSGPSHTWKKLSCKDTAQLGAPCTPAAGGLTWVYQEAFRICILSCEGLLRYEVIPVAHDNCRRHKQKQSAGDEQLCALTRILPLFERNSP